MVKPLDVVLDYDDVLVDCNGSAIERLNKEHHTNYTIYDIKSWGSINPELDKRLAYYSDPEFMASLPLLPGAREFVNALSKEARVSIMTSVAPLCAGVRVDHIIRNFPEINPSNIIIGGRKDLIRPDIILDDGHHNLENSNALYPVMYQRPWNYGKTGILSVNGYDAFLQLVHTIKNTQQKDATKAEVVSLIGPTGVGKKKLADALVETGKFERVKTYSTKEDYAHYNVLSFDEFTRREKSGFFTETSSYMGQFFGMCVNDIQHIIEKGLKPIMIVDINGAMAIQSTFNALNVFVKDEKEECIKAILTRQMNVDETVQRIASLDLELRNEEFCDITVDCNNYKKIIETLC